MSESTPFSRRLSLLVESAGSQNKLARISGVASATIGNWLNSEIRLETVLRRFAMNTGVDLDWLKEGVGDDAAQVAKLRVRLAAMENAENNRVSEEPATYGSRILPTDLGDETLAMVVDDVLDRPGMSSDERLRVLLPFIREGAKRLRHRSTPIKQPRS